MADTTLEDRLRTIHATHMRHARTHHPDCHVAEICLCGFDRLAEGGGPS